MTAMDRFKKPSRLVLGNSDANGYCSLASNGNASRKETLQAVLANARNALDIAKELAPLIPVPFLSSLFASAKVIVDASNQVLQNKLGCAELSGRVASIVKEVRKEIRGKEELVDDSLKMALQQLNDDFAEIRDFMLKEVSRGTFSRILHREDISGRIQELSVKVNDSMQTFQSTSSIRLEIKLEKVSRDVSSIDNRLAIMDGRSRAERKWDGQFRVYRLGELHEGQLISSEQRMLYTSSTDMTKGDVVEETLVSASVEGRVVAVKKFRGPNYVFNSTLDALKRDRHVNVVQLEGYSDEDTDVRFFVFKGQLRRFGDHMSMKTSPDERYNLYIRGVMSMLSGHYHLFSQGLLWLGQLEDIMVEENSGMVLLGAQDDFVHHNLEITSGDDQTIANRSSPLVRLMESLPSLVRDWNLMRDMAAYFSNGYYPVLYEPDKDPARQQYIDSVTYLDSSYGLTADERALLVVRNVLVERIKTDGYWYSTSRCSSRSIGTVGTVVVCESGLSYGENARDYTAIDSMPECDSDVVIWDERKEDGLDRILSLKSEQQYVSEAKAEMEDVVAWSLLVKYGPAIAREHGVKLKDLGIQTWENYTTMVQFKCAAGSRLPSANLTSEPDGSEVPTMTFHFRCDPESGFYKEPWGYFLFDESPLPEDCPLPMEPAEGVWAGFSRTGNDSEKDEECEEIGDPEDKCQGLEYRSTLDGIHGVTKQRSCATYIMLHADQADMLEWAHSLSFSPTRIEYRQKALYA